MRMVINAEQVINVKRDPVQVGKSQSFVPTKTFFLSQHRLNTFIIFSALPCGEPGDLGDQVLLELSLLQASRTQGIAQVDFF